MKPRLNGRFADVAASGIVMLALLLVTLLVSSATAVVDLMARSPAQTASR